MIIRFLVILLLSFNVATTALGQNREIILSADTVLIDSGFLRHILPRFSLKHGVRVQVIEGGGSAQFSLGLSGDQPAFIGGGITYFLTKHTDGDANVDKFVDWLLSDIGQNTVAAFSPEFGPVEAVIVEDAPSIFYGDAARGERLAYRNCGRCHVVGEINRMAGIDSTPSFNLLRVFPDWEARFATFYVLNPHPSFTQIADVTDPFADNLPPAIVPIEITVEELDDIIAYVAGIAPADLGAELQSQ